MPFFICASLSICILHTLRAVRENSPHKNSLLDVKQEGIDMENNQSMETNTQENQNSGNNSGQEKLFTQEEVNRIIGERLSRVKTDSTQELQARELQLDAREKLMDAGLPKELLGAINCSTKEAMENSIKVIQGLYGKNSNSKPEKPVYRVSTGISSNSNGSGNYKDSDDPSAIRKAMGLKG